MSFGLHAYFLWRSRSPQATVQSAPVAMCSALNLPEQDNEPGRPYIAFLATEVKPTAALTKKEKGSWPFGPLPTICVAPLLGRLLSEESQLSRSVTKINLKLPIPTGERMEKAILLMTQRL